MCVHITRKSGRMHTKSLAGLTSGGTEEAPRKTPFVSLISVLLKFASLCEEILSGEMQFSAKYLVHVFPSLRKLRYSPGVFWKHLIRFRTYRYLSYVLVT